LPAFGSAPFGRIGVDDAANPALRLDRLPPAQIEREYLRLRRRRHLLADLREPDDPASEATVPSGGRRPVLKPTPPDVRARPACS
jgi:hypothetical protein